MGSPKPWTVKKLEDWPFRIQILDADGLCVASFERVAWSSRDNTIEDCESARNWDLKDRESIRKQLETQLHDIYTMAGIET